MSEPRPWAAVILDLDGVVTETAEVHFRAWKRAFDPFLEARGAEPFGRADYRAHVDGRPRYAGAAAFLEARGIELPRGEPEDPPGDGTVCALGNRKNALFQELLDEVGVRVFPDARERLRDWREAGLALAVATSSRNGAKVLDAAGLTRAFDARFDGADLEREGLAGKPAPDMFLAAARRLGVAPERAVLLEDAEAGVAAGRAGGFGLVVGVRRDGRSQPLREAGADLVVRTLRELGRDAAPLVTPAREVPTALEDLESVEARLRERRPLLFLDYDGTLTPIVEDPDQAVLSDAMREALRGLARRFTVAVVSGRDRADVAQKVGLDELVYAGSHGFDIAGPGGLRRQHEEAEAYLPRLDQAQSDLTAQLTGRSGALVERKRYAIAVHYRRVAAAEAPRVEEAVDAALGRYGLSKGGGKKVFELKPPVDWDKGRAVLWLRDQLAPDEPTVAVYVGDDLTDEDAFLALRELGEGGLGVLVGCPDRETAADYRLPDDPEAVRRLLERLAAA